MNTKEEKFMNAVRAVSFGITTADEYSYDQKKLQLLADTMRVKREKEERGGGK